MTPNWVGMGKNLLEPHVTGCIHPLIPGFDALRTTIKNISLGIGDSGLSPRHIGCRAGRKNHQAEGAGDQEVQEFGGEDHM